jgi:hypothetical protein
MDATSRIYALLVAEKHEHDFSDPRLVTDCSLQFKSILPPFILTVPNWLTI